MCGILGCVTKEKIDKDFFTKNLLKLHSRGPDNYGVFIEKNVYLGHTRLSIIDISSQANQPFIYNDYVLIFNGEIYNFQYIRNILIEKGFKFKTTSDTEVLLYSYIFWGEKCVDYLDGMWAFCIFDKRKNILFLSRDRIGEKPLLYYNDTEKFIFSSELNALLPFVKKLNINNLALSNFDVYNFRHIPSPHTPFENVFKLNPGYNIIFDLNTKKINKYKFLKINNIDIKSDPIDQFDIIFKESVKKTCFADVPIGIFLSGGIDSSLIASIMKNKNITTYSIGYDYNDPEIIRANKIAEFLNLKNKKIYFKDFIEKVNIFDILKQVIGHYGEPINLMQIIYADIILKEMKKDGIKVAIGGNGADEMFYGYDGTNKLYLISDIKKFFDYMLVGKIINNKNIKDLLYKIELNKRNFIKNEYKKFLYEREFFEYANEIPYKNLIDIFSWLGLRIENEHSITIINDISGSINGMEVRSPFLNKDIIDFSCNLSYKYKVKSYKDKTFNKYILKKVLERYLPIELIYQKKMGFGYGINYNNILLKYTNYIDYYIYDVSKKINIYDHKEIIKIYKNLKEGNKGNIRHLLTVILVSIWYESFFSNKYI